MLSNKRLVKSNGILFLNLSTLKYCIRRTNTYKVKFFKITMKNKKAKGMIEELVVILSVSLILVFFLIFLFSATNLFVDERKKDTQIIIKKILHDNCFSQDFASIDQEKFNQETIDTCLNGHNENTLIRIRLDATSKTFYVNEKREEFLQKSKFCNDISSTLCTQMYYPITYIVNNNEEISVLSIQIIT